MENLKKEGYGYQISLEDFWNWYENQLNALAAGNISFRNSKFSGKL